MKRSRPRRTRYTVTLASGEEKLILAYDAAGARDHYERRGLAVIHVVKGDLVNGPAARPQGGGWRIDRANLRQAIEVLGIRHPVEIKQTSRVGNQQGRHRPTPTGGQVYIRGGKVYNPDTATGLKHSITVKSYLTPEEAGRTLWHELTHAMQAERIEGTPAQVLRALHAQYRDGTPYRHKPMEVEARSFGSWNDDCPLAR